MKKNGCHTFFDILWLEDATKTHFCTFAIAEATFSTHHGHWYVFGSVSSQPKASKFSEKCQGRSTFLASLPQWVGHSQRLGYGQVRLPDGEKGHQFESNSQTRYSQENWSVSTRLNLQQNNAVPKELM